MLKRSVEVLVTALAITGTAICAAGGASAANDPPWTMPDVVGQTLQKAEDTLLAVTGDPDMDIRTSSPKINQEQINLTNWVVCYQSPKADGTISEKTKRVYLYVKRPNEKSCWP